MAPLDPQFVGSLQAVPGLISVSFLWIAVKNRDKPGSISFGLFSLGMFVYSVGLMLGNFTGQYDLSVGAWHLSLVGAHILGISWFTLAAEVTGRVRTTTSIKTILVGYFVVFQAILWSNPYHELVYIPGDLRDGIVFETAGFTVGFWLFFLGIYLLITIAMALLVLEAVRSTGLRQQQMLLLAIGGVPTIVANLLSANGLGLGSHDITVFGYVITAFFFALVLYSGRFLDIVPVARRAAMGEMDDAVITVDDENRVIDANEAALSLFDASETEVGTPFDVFFETLPAEARSRLIAPDEVDTEITAELNEEQRHFSVSKSAIGSNSRVIVLRDITIQKRRENRLQRQNERFRALFENVSDAVVEYTFEDETPVVVRVNDAFEDMFGYQQEEVQGETIDELIVPPDQQRDAEQLSQRVQHGEAIRREVERETAEGRRTFLFRYAPFEIEEQLQGYSLYTDISKRIQRERELERQNERLEQFASVVSHDLRNPLNAAQLQFDLVSEEIPDEQATAVEQNLDRMETMIEDLLTLARVGQTVQTTEAVSLDTLAATAWEHTDTSDCELVSSLPAEFTVQADRDRLLHVFENLFRNAVEHNETPLTVRIGPLSGGDSAASETPARGFFVADDGSGIPADNRESVFDHGYTTSEAGTGFGLSIVLDIVQAHGWNIQVTESDDGGARFEITGLEPGQTAHRNGNVKSSSRQ